MLTSIWDRLAAKLAPRPSDGTEPPSICIGNHVYTDNDIIECMGLHGVDIHIEHLNGEGIYRLTILGDGSRQISVEFTPGDFDSDDYVLADYWSVGKDEWAWDLERHDNPLDG